MNKKLAFTLAEVLITLAIIGIVAALTIPTLVQTYKKRAVETKLLKIYSVMNQAIKLSTVDNGDTNTWEGIANSSATYEDTLAWFNRYLAPYLRYTELKQKNDTQDLLVYLSDGTALLIRNRIYDIFYVMKTKSLDDNSYKVGINAFAFRFQPKYYTDAQKTDINMKYTVNPGFEPYTYNWDGTKDGVKYSTIAGYGCYDGERTNYANLCTKLIQLNNWKIPDDYPYKF